MRFDPDPLRSAGHCVGIGKPRPSSGAQNDCVSYKLAQNSGNCERSRARRPTALRTCYEQRPLLVARTPTTAGRAPCAECSAQPVQSQFPPSGPDAKIRARSITGASARIASARACSRSSSRNNPSDSAETNSPQTFCRGNSLLSNSTTEAPLRAAVMAAEAPAGPPPTTAR